MLEDAYAVNRLGRDMHMLLNILGNTVPDNQRPPKVKHQRQAAYVAYMPAPTASHRTENGLSAPFSMTALQQ